jgi:hypothetical protein
LYVSRQHGDTPFSYGADGALGGDGDARDLAILAG